MIRYALICAKDHEFDAWFASAQGYDDQKERRLVECPACGARDVRKALMTPAVATSRRREVGTPPPESLPDTGTTAPAERAPQLAALPPEKQAIVEQIRSLKKKLMEGAEDVGPRFPEEARKIHYGESSPRGIYGKASLEEAGDLAEEGIEFLPLPDLPGDQN